LRKAGHTLNYPKDTQLNTIIPNTNLRYSSSRLLRKDPAQPCNFHYPIDFVVKHPVAPAETGAHPEVGLNSSRKLLRDSALLKVQDPSKGSSTLNRCAVGDFSSVGGADRDRTGDPLLAKQVLSQLSYSPIHQMVGLGRFELPTSPLSGVRSNQLSYRPARAMLMPGWCQCLITRKVSRTR
jgi:hypothetical protein